jgi:D-serine deaminase-like pyridoxal phosphate-dependent protein
MPDTSSLVPVEALDTPRLVVDRDVLDANVRMLAAAGRAAGLEVRPHAKTHKCLQIAERQIDAGACGLTVATVSEAEVFAAAGVDDLFIAYPVWASPARGRRLRALAERVRLRVGVDSADAATVLASALSGTTAEVLVEVDSGHHRSGTSPAGAGDIAVAAARAGLHVRGVFTFPGHGYSPGQRSAAARQEAQALRTAAQAVAEAGLDAGVRSGGSTPTVAEADASVLSEVRPGVYVFNDAQQLELGTCSWTDIALTAATTVVSANDDHLILDAGSKVLGADQPGWATGGGRLPGYPDARVVALSEHHATVTCPPGSAAPSLGDVVRLAPNHVCSAVNLADELTVVSQGRVVDVWPVAARGANT